MQQTCEIWVCCMHAECWDTSDDLMATDDEKKYIVTNPEVIAIDQDPFGIAGDRIYNMSSGAQV